MAKVLSNKKLQNALLDSRVSQESKKAILNILQKNIKNIQVSGYPNYFVCEDGTVISTKRPYLHVLTQQDNGLGYKYVSISNKRNKGNDMVYIHRLVADHFCYNPYKYSNRDSEVHHLDKNNANNSSTNLIWVDSDTHKIIEGIDRFAFVKNNKATKSYKCPYNVLDRYGIVLEDFLYRIDNTEPIGTDKGFELYECKGIVIGVKKHTKKKQPKPHKRKK